MTEVREYLDIREINGYSIHYTPFFPADGSAAISTLVYIGTPDNEQFTGPQDPQELAEHIWRSEGPSGLNRDYLLSLEGALEGLSEESGDGHVRDLAERVRRIAGASTGQGAGVQVEGEKVLSHEVEKMEGTDRQEENEKSTSTDEKSS